MKKTYFLQLALILFSATGANAQGGVAINAAGVPPDSSAELDVSSASKGTLLTRMSTAQRNAIVNPAEGLTIFNTDCHVFNFNAGTPIAPNWATLNSSNALTAGVSITASPAGAICAGTSVTFSATPSQNNLSPSYQWQINGNNIGSNSATFTDSSLTSGDVVTCILSSNVNCVTGSPATSNAITMLVNIVPAITGATPAAFCSGSAVTLNASANLGTINWYANSAGGSSLSSGASFTISGLTGSAIYYVDATANGCTTGIRTPVAATFYPGIPGQPGAITGPASDSTNAAAIYSISPVPNVENYAWSVTIGMITSGQGTDSISANADSSGFRTVAVTANNPCGASTAQTLAVDVQIQGQVFTVTGSGYAGSLQTYTAPVTGAYTIAAYGAQGGSAATPGGLGAFMQGTFNLTQGQQLNILVGQSGANPPQLGSGGGGGGTFVVLNGNPLIVAAGGGGGGASYPGGPGLTTINGGSSTGGNASAGGTANAGGTAGSGGNYQGGGGGGGTCCNGQDGNNGGGLGGGGGAGFTGNGGDGENGPTDAYSYVNGGYGGYHNDGYGNSGNSYGGYGGGGSGVSYNYQSGGGGGGGYTGGGGGSGVGVGGGGGGGGSYNSGTNQIGQSGVQSGNGQVIIAAP